MADSGQEKASGVPHVVVVGGGIAGLAAAFFLRDEPVRLTVLEGASRLGGKLAVSEVEGFAVDEGAESLYARRPKTSRLITEAGLGDQLVTASLPGMGIWTRDDMRGLPARQFMGVPSDMEELAKARLLSADGLARAREDLELPALDRDGDVSVASYVAGRQGQEVVDRLVDPFLGDAFAGRADELSFEATLAPLAAASRKYSSLAEAAGSLIPQPLPEGEKPTTGIATLTGGLGTLPPVLAERLLAASPGATVRTGAVVEELVRRERGWRLTVGSGAGSEYIDADAVVVAVPAGSAGRLLAGVSGAGQAAAGLAEIPYASTAIITLAYTRSAFSAGFAGLRRLGASGYRVPAVEGRKVRVVTFLNMKWPHLAGDLQIVRCQAGGSGEEKLMELDDAELGALAASEFAATTGLVGGPVATRVSRWEASMPQYTVGHLDRVERIRASVAAQPGLAVCGAAYDGAGVGNCVATARKAADEVLTWLRRDTTAR
ncbi:protoporphyrinogen oxidase [Streptomyces sp. NPDC101151]|uniref:protoporphyrinogen oxidase n=1 Tax=Streptomyces sp. NPDC101151 TaxID=3366115 RepID=UPI0038169E61